MRFITQPSVQSLFLEMRFDGTVISSGTGFAVDSPKGPLLITNLHNVTGRNSVTGKALSPTGAIPNELAILHNQEGQLGKWISRSEPLLDSDGRQLWREHPTLGTRADIVALPLKNLGGTQLYPINLTDTLAKWRWGPPEAVSVVGFPFGLRPGLGVLAWEALPASTVTNPPSPRRP